MYVQRALARGKQGRPESFTAEATERAAESPENDAMNPVVRRVTSGEGQELARGGSAPPTDFGSCRAPLDRRLLADSAHTQNPRKRSHEL
jgi:hypothetical protein